MVVWSEQTGETQILFLQVPGEAAAQVLLAWHGTVFFPEKGANVPVIFSLFSVASCVGDSYTDTVEPNWSSAYFASFYQYG